MHNCFGKRVRFSIFTGKRESKRNLTADEKRTIKDFNFGREVKHFKIHIVDIANNFNKLKVILIRITS